MKQILIFALLLMSFTTNAQRLTDFQTFKTCTEFQGADFITVIGHRNGDTVKFHLVGFYGKKSKHKKIEVLLSSVSQTEKGMKIGGILLSNPTDYWAETETNPAFAAGK